MNNSQLIQKRNQVVTNDQPYFQLNFIKIKDGEQILFEEARAEYIEKRREHTNTTTKLYVSIFSFPKKNAEGVYIELIRWNSPREAMEVTKILSQLVETKKYIATFDQKASFRMRTAVGESFDINQLLDENQVIEFAVRQIKPSKRKVYPKWRKKFLGNIINKAGYMFDQEFVAIDEDLDILLFGWDSQKSFEQAGKQVRRSPLVMLKLLKYFSLIRSEEFQVGKIIDESV